MSVAAGSVAGGTAATVAAIIAQAIKASGAIVSVKPQDMMTILSKSEKPLVAHAEGGFLKANYQYLTNYKGLFFYTKSATPLALPGGVELIAVKKIWIP